jgi:hypothetical protein
MSMQTTKRMGLGGRERRRLELARERGFLDGTFANREKVARSYGLWCWRLKVPVIWFERQTPRSRYGRLRLDLVTTMNVLTDAGQAAMRRLGADWPSPPRARVSPHDACWERVPLKRLGELATAVLRTATRGGNYQLDESAADSLPAARMTPAKVIYLKASA